MVGCWGVDVALLGRDCLSQSGGSLLGSGGSAVRIDDGLPVGSDDRGGAVDGWQAWSSGHKGGLIGLVGDWQNGLIGAGGDMCCSWCSVRESSVPEFRSYTGRTPRFIGIYAEYQCVVEQDLYVCTHTISSMRQQEKYQDARRSNIPSTRP